MDVRILSGSDVTDFTVADLPRLLDQADGVVWVDIRAWDDEAADVLSNVFHAHPLVIETCRTRNHVPAVHAYDEHMFFVLFSPLLGALGKVHLLELDLIVGHNYIVSIHGPFGSSVDPARAFQEIESVLRWLRHRDKPTSRERLNFAIVSALARSQRALISDVADRIPALEREVMESQLRDPEALLEQLFLVRHELITARTMAAQCHDVFARVTMLERWVVEHERKFVRDLADQFDRIRSIADGEAQFLFGVIELYQTKVHTKMTVAMERLAVIAAVTLPVAAVASVFGMQFIAYNEQTKWPPLIVVLLVMAAMSGTLLRWARKQGWW